ncbi:hypothetical protein [Paraliomyxa miuraensis]|uniref:hypothetical protein n=1 Tax=Paraliomyxa miuraensis TaxID=376150 RepID=UPI002259BF7B|nr:hypothetical protein [Paraliomyxa miuraensis]MCX4246473.1 hypothetical protein [Paraliomyxa miuraensis]
MGITISVVVDPSCISRTAWSQVYEETLTLLGQWPDPPLRPAYREVAGVELVAYSRAVAEPDAWHVCGDANSRLFAESIELPRELGVDQPREPPGELLLRVLESWRPPGDGEALEWLLHRKTQGKPFHLLVLAVAMLIEHRLPHAAFAMGDFSRQEARQAQTHLRTILGEEISLPLAARPKALADRLQPHFAGEALGDAVDELVCRGPLAGLLISLFDGSLGSYERQEIERAVACTDVSSLDELTRNGFEFLIGQAKAVFGEWSSDDPGDPIAYPDDLLALDAHELLQVIAMGTKKTHLRLTEMAWDDLEHACANEALDELRLLALLATHPTSELVAHQLRRAVFESPAIRRFCTRAWDTIEIAVPRNYQFQARLFDEACAST